MENIRTFAQGTRSAIISIVHTLTIGLAVFVILSHGIAIFWPRKAIDVPVDEEGRPILWHNETSSTKDVVCVWWEDSEEDQAATAAADAASTHPLPSFSHVVRPLSGHTGEGHRSVA